MVDLVHVFGFFSEHVQEFDCFNKVAEFGSFFWSSLHGNFHYSKSAGFGLCGFFTCLIFVKTGKNGYSVRIGWGEFGSSGRYMW